MSTMNRIRMLCRVLVIVLRGKLNKRNWPWVLWALRGGD